MTTVDEHRTHASIQRLARELPEHLARIAAALERLAELGTLDFERARRDAGELPLERIAAALEDLAGEQCERRERRARLAAELARAEGRKRA
jgi:predicted transcriptional regulator